jgi:hypothetical protein
MVQANHVLTAVATLRKVALMAFLATMPAQAEVQPAIFAATFSPLRLERPFIFLLRPPEHVCTTFSVRAVHDSVADAVLTSTGLGSTTFAITSNSSKLDCSKTYPTEGRTLNISDITQREIIIRMRVPVAAFPGPGEHLEGKLRLIAIPKLSIDTPMRLDGTPPNTWWKVASWVFGLLFPTILATYISYKLFVFEKRWEESKAERDHFNDYLSEHWADLNEFFREFLPNLNRTANDEVEWASTLESRLVEFGLNQSPSRLRKKFRASLASGPRDRTLSILGEIYSDWRKPILGRTK